MRKTKAKVVVVALALGLACASASNASGVVTSASSREAQAAKSPNPTPSSPDLDEIRRIKNGETPPALPQPLDVTGTADEQVQIDELSSLLSNGTVADGGLEWDATSKKVIVRLVGDIDGKSTAMQARKTSVLTKAKDLTGKGFKVEFRSVKYSRAELEQLATRLFATVEQWAPGLTTYSSSSDTRTGVGGGWDPKTNRVELVVPEDKLQAWTDRVRALKDDRITITTYKEAPGGIKARRASRQSGMLPNRVAAPGDCDSTPCRIDDWGANYGLRWSGGIWLTDINRVPNPSGGDADCTAGFNWRQWQTNVTYGSTAYHCWANDADIAWWHNTDWWGNLEITSPASDTMLFEGGTLDYGATVYVGDQTTNVLRWVVGVDTSWAVGDQVALSGANSGLLVSSVKNPAYKDPGDGRTYVLMNTRIGYQGDSGAPMLTTRSTDGQVLAHGQMVGWGPTGTVNDGTEFMSVGYISGKVGASILVAYL